jgi:hypothetical protein
MAQKIINGNGIVSLGTVECEEDLKPQPGVNLNPPPQDGRCDCCGRHISKLKPFGGPGDPLVGDFSGALLIKKFRPDGPYDEEAEKAYNEAEACYKQAGFDDIDGYLTSRYGQEIGERISMAVCFHHSVDKSWECRDCAVLSTDKYFEKLRQSWT